MKDLESMPRLETERLLLRPFCLYDVTPYHKLVSNPLVLKGTDMPHEINEKAAREWILSHPDAWKHRKDVYLVITEKATRALMGSVSMFTYERHDKCEMGFWLTPSRWGKGYASEAASRLLKFAFEEMQLHRVEANHMLRNPKSGRVLAKLGFKYEGLFRDSYLKDGDFVDLKFYGLLKSEYLANVNKDANR